jgi:hypothetical protein
MVFGFGGVVSVTLPNKYASSWFVRLIDYTCRPIWRGKGRYRKDATSSTMPTIKSRKNQELCLFMLGSSVLPRKSGFYEQVIHVKGFLFFFPGVLVSAVVLF